MLIINVCILKYFRLIKNNMECVKIYLFLCVNNKNLYM